jgi:hypothetical protein
MLEEHSWRIAMARQVTDVLGGKAGTVSVFSLFDLILGPPTNALKTVLYQ